MAKSATIYEVARRAGVSIATVSRVQRGHAVVQHETRERVLRAIEELRYRPSRAARSLAGHPHDATGIVFPDLSGPYYSEVILGYEDQSAALGQSVLILGTHGRPEAVQLVVDLASRVDGLVLMGRTVPDPVIEQLADERLPIVLLARPATEAVDTVRAENVASAVALTEHLIDHGHERITFLGDPPSSPDAAERWAGFAEAHRRRGRAPDPLLSAAFRERAGYLAALEALTARPRPSALMCANDEIALGSYGAARQLGLRVPDDVAITGWDDIPIARFTAPSLTTVRQPLRELGAEAARLLTERIRGDRSVPHHVVLPTHPVWRSSCGCVNASGAGDEAGRDRGEDR